MTDDDFRQRGAAKKRDRSKAAILGAATSLFREKGWGPTTIGQIAQEADVGAATIYNHFKNKNVIAGHVYAPVMQGVLSDPRWDDTDLEAADALEMFVTDVTTTARQNLKLTVALLEAVNDATARNGSKITPDDPRFWVPLPPILSKIIARGQADGSLLAYPPAADAGPLLSNMLLLRILTRPDEDIAEEVRLMVTLINRTFGLKHSPLAT
jgi:AcrR family transcriptional regulator